MLGVAVCMCALRWVRKDGWDLLPLLSRPDLLRLNHLGSQGGSKECTPRPMSPGPPGSPQGCLVPLQALRLSWLILTCLKREDEIGKVSSRGSASVLGIK